MMKLSIWNLIYAFLGMGKVLEGKEELGKPILWGMGWVNRRLGSFGGHPIC